MEMFSVEEQEKKKKRPAVIMKPSTPSGSCFCAETQRCSFSPAAAIDPEPALCNSAHVPFRDSTPAPTFSSTLVKTWKVINKWPLCCRTNTDGIWLTHGGLAEPWAGPGEAGDRLTKSYGPVWVSAWERRGEKKKKYVWKWSGFAQKSPFLNWLLPFFFF